VNDAEDEDRPVLHDNVVHHAEIADAESVECVVRSLDRLDRLAPDTPRRGDIDRELLQRLADPRALLGREALERSGGRDREPDVVRVQSRSPRRTERPAR
jgi:hypothetical protein